MNTCLVCGKFLKGRQQQCCSRSCSGSVGGRRGSKGRKRINLFCEVCGKNYTRRKGQAARSRFCSRKCQGISLHRSSEVEQGAVNSKVVSSILTDAD